MAATIIVIAVLPLPKAAPYAPAIAHDQEAGLIHISRQTPVLVLGVLVVATLYSSAWALLPVYCIRVGFNDTDAALLLSSVAAGGVAFQYPVGWLGDRFERHTVLMACAGMSAILVALVPLALSKPWLLYAVLFCWGGAFAAIYTMAMAIGGDRFRGTALAALMAVFGVMWGLGSIVGPLTGAIAMGSIGPQGLIVLCTLLPTVWFVLAYYTFRQRGG